mmetsp:Transcript_14036/g.21435  ORF Transcript_14036/g.21435 Transcript_14036/m.21435 type:complete len:95 (+) Transcript_14036:3488-3772(+)
MLNYFLVTDAQFLLCWMLFVTIAPDIEKLIPFCSINMGWEASDTRRMLEPIVERLEKGMRQTRLDMFMNYKDNIQFANVKSKRLRDVLKKSRKD